jgi:hypothetical protein
MATAGDPFIWTPDNIPPKPLSKKYAFVRSQADSPYKIQRQLTDATPLEEFELDFGEIPAIGSPTGNNRNDIKAHWDAQIIDLYKFYWNSVPAYIAVAPFYVRYLPDGYQEEPLRGDGKTAVIWSVKIKFMKEV